MEGYALDFGFEGGFETLHAARRYHEDYGISFDAGRFCAEHLVWHHSGTASLCGLVSARLGLASGCRLDVKQAAFLHDVGKLLLPQAVWMNDAALSQDEMLCMQMHSALGADIVAKRGHGRAIALAVRHHHEWWDGTGYPDGLRGESIPLAARIVSICDAVDAMLVGRHYRPRLGFSQVLQELAMMAKVQFDPELVAVMIDILRERRSKTNVQSRA